MEAENVDGEGRRVRLAVSPESGLIGVYETGRVSVLTMSDLTAIAEIGTEGDFDDNDVVFVGNRLVVLSRSARQTRLHVVDPLGPAKVGEASFRTEMSIAAVAGEHILAIGGGQTAIVDLTKTAPIATTLPVRGAVSAAGPMGSTGFVIVSGGALEEWDAAARKPLRRIRLGRPLEPAFVGGDADRVWMISRQTPRHVEIITLTRRSSHTIELVTEPRHVAANTRGDLLAMICGETCSTYIVDVARPGPPRRVDRGPMAAIAWSGTHTMVLQPEAQPLELFSLPRPAEPVRATAEVEISTPAQAIEHTVPRPRTAEAESPKPWTHDEISERLAAWRARVSSRAAASAEPATAIPSSPAPAAAAAASHQAASEPTRTSPQHGALHPPPPGGWRSEIASWARSICARSYRTAPTLDHGVLDELITRLDFDAELRDAVALLYGAYLNGLAGVAPIDLAAVIHWDWDKAIGDGELVRSGIVQWCGGRVVLVPETIAALDGRPPRTGTIIGLDGPMGIAGAIVAPGDVDVLQLGAWAAPVVGALLVPNRHGERAPHRFMLEARIRGLVPLVPWLRFRNALKVPPRTAAVLVEHPAAAAGLDLPVVATWSVTSQAPD